MGTVTFRAVPGAEKVSGQGKDADATQELPALLAKADVREPGKACRR